MRSRGSFEHTRGHWRPRRSDSDDMLQCQRWRWCGHIASLLGWAPNAHCRADVRRTPLHGPNPPRGAKHGESVAPPAWQVRYLRARLKPAHRLLNVRDHSQVRDPRPHTPGRPGGCSLRTSPILRRTTRATACNWPRARNRTCPASRRARNELGRVQNHNPRGSV